MFGILCEVESCFHNLNRMCFCPKKVLLTEQQFLGAVFLVCSEYINKDREPEKVTAQDKIPTV